MFWALSNSDGDAHVPHARAEDAHAFNPASVSYYTVSLRSAAALGQGLGRACQRASCAAGDPPVWRVGRWPRGIALRPKAAPTCFPPWPHSLQDQIGSMVPGIVLGSICAVGFILMLAWICVRFCRWRQLAAPPEAQQFLSSGGEPSVPIMGTASALEFPQRGE